jgi:hypothetical protein
MSIFNNPAVKYNYEEGNGVTLSSFNEPTSTISNVIGSSTISQKNVENLEDDLGNISICVNDSRMKITNLEQDFSSYKDVVEDKLYSLNVRIKNVKVEVDVNKAAQNMINERHFNHIKKLTKESMIMFFMIILLFIIDLATIWFIIRK